MEDIIEIQNLIYEIRGQRVMLDKDLARLYEVETRSLNQAVKRNIERFPADFMFQLTREEENFLISQFVISKKDPTEDGRGGLRKLSYAFTEQCVAMLSGVLRSRRAVEVNIAIMRAFVEMRKFALSQPDTTNQIMELRKTMLLYMDKNDKRVDTIMEALNALLAKPPEPKRLIGFR
ncbi:MAG: ORF6N domain-containing protein [Spirochaetaceae bacterium]|jgi:hypothetical protein|nr:ORF6N domain-containing protein [Spirochaetaceae bacterium]